MLTEQDLRDALADAVDDPAAEALTLGLSDRALDDAGRRGRRGSLRLGMSRRRRRWVQGAAIATAGTVAAVLGVAVFGGVGFGGGGATVKSSTVPATAPNPQGQAALLEFGAECLKSGQGPQLEMSYVWDPAAQQYRGVPGDLWTAFSPSPDGKRALVTKGLPHPAWAVASWSDAVAGRVVWHSISDGISLRWTDDGSELVSVPAVDDQPTADSAGKSGPIVVQNKTVDFYDPATGNKHSVPIPQAVVDRVTSGQWVLQQWEGDHDSVRFPMAGVEGDRIEWLDAQGKVARTLTVQNGLPADVQYSLPTLQVTISPDGRYLAEATDATLAVYDLRDHGRRVALSSGDVNPQRNYYLGWAGPHEIVVAVDEMVEKYYGKTGMPKTGHNPVYKVLSPELKVIQEARFVLPADPKGICSTWPVSWAPKGQFPGAFVP